MNSCTFMHPYIVSTPGRFQDFSSMIVVEFALSCIILTAYVHVVPIVHV